MAATVLPYKGPDRRRALRRLSSDRRKLLRWEPSKDDRRSGKDRRQSVANLWDRTFNR